MTLFVIKETFFESRRVRRIHQLQFKLQEGIRPGIMSAYITLDHLGRVSNLHDSREWTREAETQTLNDHGYEDVDH